MTIEERPVPSPEVAAYLARQPTKRPIRHRPLDEVRRDVLEWALEVGGVPEPVALVEECEAGGVPARLYRPVGGEREVLVWLHGGAWMLGDLDSCDAVVRALANRAGCAVLAVDYRLAPEHRFPAAVEDGWAATMWAAKRFERTAVGGDSAGGNLAAAVALRARDRGVRLALQLLVYPITDYAVHTPFYRSFRERYAHFAGQEGFGAVSFDDIRYMWKSYAPDPSERLDRDAAPLRAATLRGACPAFVITVEHDILREEAQRYARRLHDEGVPVELHHYPQDVHGLFHMQGVLDNARDAVDRAAAALRAAFRPPGATRPPVASRSLP